MPTYKEFKKSYDFDSRIMEPFSSADPRYFGLVLLLRIALVQLNPPKGWYGFKVRDSSDIPRSALRWNGAAWSHFKARFLEVVLATWDSAFLLTPPDTYDGLIWPERGGTRRLVLCNLSIELVDDPAAAHAIMSVARLADPHGSFGSNSTLLATDDVDGTVHGDLKSHLQWKQHAAAHEVGHLLGFGHSGQKSRKCRAGDQDTCYGSNLPERLNIMGTGDMLSEENAKPWLERIEWHTGVDRDKWTVDWASRDAEYRGTESIEDTPKRVSR